MEDNQGTMALANPVAHARTKHIDIKYHYICEAIQDMLQYFKREYVIRLI